MHNRRFFLAAFISSLIAYFGGWLIFGIVFSDYYSSNVNEAARLLSREEPRLWAIAVSNIAWALLLTWVIRKTHNSSFIKGFSVSLWVSFLIVLLFNFSVYAFWDIYPIGFVIIDTIITSIFWAFVGAIAGTVLGYRRHVAASA